MSTSTAALSIAACVGGVVLGVSGTVFATAGDTPSEADPALLDSVAAEAREQGRGEAGAEVDAQLVAVQDRLAAARSKFADLRAHVLDLREEVDASRQEVARLRSEAVSDEDTTVRVTGTLKSTWILTSALEPWPTGCAGAQNSYQIRVKDGAGATVALAPMIANQVAERTEKNGILTLACVLTYAAEVSVADGAVYEFMAVSEGDPNTELGSLVVPAAEIGDGTGPELFLSFCPGCS